MGLGGGHYARGVLINDRGDDGVIIDKDGEPGTISKFRLILDKDQTKAILPTVLANVRDSNPRKAELVGGPRHGEVISIEHDPYTTEINFPSDRAYQGFTTNLGNPVEVQHFTTGRYLRTFSYRVDQDGGVCVIYEHEDLKKVNVAKRAKELDEKLSFYEAQYQRLAEDAAILDKKAINYRDSFIVPAIEERDQIAYDHGV